MAVIDPELARLAWEFLRRNRRYRADYDDIRSGRLEVLPEHWGLREPVDPYGSDIEVAAIWRAAAGRRWRSRQRARFG